VLFKLKLAIARFVGFLSRITGRGGGTSLPGKVLLKLDGDALADLTKSADAETILISATNGKTTTTSLLGEILKTDEKNYVTNLSGANMTAGIVSSLIAQPKEVIDNAEACLFEVDEFWLSDIVSKTEPEFVLLANLFRDQLDRYGELEEIVNRWDEVLRSPAAAKTHFILNADDPAVAYLGRDLSNVTYFGIEDRCCANQLSAVADFKYCRVCGAPYKYEAAYIGHLGIYACSSCGHSRPRPKVYLNKVELDGTDGSNLEITVDGGPSFSIHTSLPGLYNVYNVLGAAAAALELDIDVSSIKNGLESASPAFGRAETIQVDDKQVMLLLIKNPTGANEVLRTVAQVDEPLTLLAVLNDRIADGRDVSWIWDASFELLDGKVEQVICSGIRAAELALRFKYAGIDPSKIKIIAGLDKALDQALAESKNRLYVLPTYTAMIELRKLLTDYGYVNAYWQEDT